MKTKVESHALLQMWHQARTTWSRRTLQRLHICVQIFCRLVGMDSVMHEDAWIWLASHAVLSAVGDSRWLVGMWHCCFHMIRKTLFLTRSQSQIWRSSQHSTRPTMNTAKRYSNNKNDPVQLPLQTACSHVILLVVPLDISTWVTLWYHRRQRSHRTTKV